MVYFLWNFQESLVARIFFVKTRKVRRSSNCLQKSRSSLWETCFWKFSMHLKVILKFEGVSTGLTNLEITFFMFETVTKKNINFQIEFFLKISFWLSSYPSLFYSWNEICDSGSYPSGKCPFGKISLGDLSVEEIVCSGNCPSENYPSGNCPSGKCLPETVRRRHDHRGILHKILPPFLTTSHHLLLPPL